VLFPFSGIIPKDSRWSDSKRPFPTFSNPKYISVVGFLTGTLPPESDGAPKRFVVEVHSMTFLGTAPQAYPKSVAVFLSHPTSLTCYITALTPASKGKRKAGLEFDETPTKKGKSS
jgi:hypothetical protein